LSVKAALQPDDTVLRPVIRAALEYLSASKHGAAWPMSDANVQKIGTWLAAYPDTATVEKQLRIIDVALSNPKPYWTGSAPLGAIWGNSYPKHVADAGYGPQKNRARSASEDPHFSDEELMERWMDQPRAYFRGLCDASDNDVTVARLRALGLPMDDEPPGRMVEPEPMDTVDGHGWMDGRDG
jgi:hypothetical protein